MMNNIIILVILTPIFACLLNLLHQRKNLSFYISTCAVFATFIGALYMLTFTLTHNDILYHFGGWVAPIGIEFKVTKLNAAFLTIVSFIASITFIYGKAILFLEIKGNRISQLCSVFLMSISGMYGVILTNDFFNLYVFIEIASLTSYAVVSISEGKESLKAGFYYLIAGTVGATIILIGIGYLYTSSGTLNMDDFTFNMMPEIKNSKATKAGCYLILVGLFIKSALFPFHSWMIKVYRSTNSFVLPFVGSITTKVYIFVVIKLIYFVFTPEYIFGNGIMQSFLLAMGSIAVIIASIAAMKQQNLRSLLAFSSVSQIGYIFIAIAIGSTNAIVVSMIFISSHILAKSALFMICAQILMHKKSLEIKDLFMMRSNLPYTSILFAINGASLVGIPLTFGFAAKLNLFLELIKDGAWVLVCVVAVGSFITFKYFWKIIEVFSFSEKYDIDTNINLNSTNTISKIKQRKHAEMLNIYSYNKVGMCIITFITLLNISIGVFFMKIFEITSNLL